MSGVRRPRLYQFEDRDYARRDVWHVAHGSPKTNWRGSLFYTRLIVMALTIGTAAFVVLTACDSPPPYTPEPDPGFTAFLQDCAAHVGVWRPGEVAYPGQLDVVDGSSATYAATVDVRGIKIGPPKEIPGNDTRREAVFAQCAIAARLVPVGSLKVDPPDWTVREFSPSGTVDWAWTIAVTEAKDQQVRLEVEPAIRNDEGFARVGDSGDHVVTYTTEIAVRANLIQRVNQAISDNKLAAGGIGAAAIALLTFWGKLTAAVKRLRRGAKPNSDDDADTADRAPQPEDGDG